MLNSGARMSAYRLTLLAVFVSFLFFSGSKEIHAHIEADMPDPIAKVEYQMMLEFEPDDIITRYKLAMVYYRLNKDAEAETELQKVLEANPIYFNALEGLGMLRLRQEKFSDAITHLKKALQQKDHESSTYYYLGLAKQGLNNRPEAHEAFSAGLAKCLSEPETSRAISVEQFNEALAKTGK